MRGLPIAQYPEIVPPMVQVTTTFIGASATDVEASVATPLEQKINGVEKGIYMKSTNANDGTLTLKVSFEVGIEPGHGQRAHAEPRVARRLPQMPQSVKNYGVTVKKALAFPLLVISVKSPNGTYDNNFLSNYTTININDTSRVSQASARSTCSAAATTRCGCGSAPIASRKLGITVPDIANAISQQNQLSPAGQIGGPPAPRRARNSPTPCARRAGCSTRSEFGDIILRTNAGRLARCA